MSKLKIIFMGTPEFAVPALDSIHSEYGVEAVVTVPDKPKGRGLKLAFSKVKEKALELKIPVYQPISLKDEDFLSTISNINPEIIVVIAFRILPRELYSMAKIASFNIHGSLLPKYRGAAPINHAIINGEKKTGLTSFVLQEKVDTGNILLKSEIDIDDEMTAGELHDLLMPLAADLSLSTIELLLSGNYSPIIQSDDEASPAPKLNKENTKLNWDLPAVKIINLIRGLSPYPGAWSNMDGNNLKIFKAVKTNSKTLSPKQYRIDKKQFLVGTTDYDISLLQIQPQNKNSMNISNFLNGYRGSETGFFD